MKKFLVGSAVALSLAVHLVILVFDAEPSNRSSRGWGGNSSGSGYSGWSGGHK